MKIQKTGQPIRVRADHVLEVPPYPLIPVIEGDGVGADITPVMRKVVDDAVFKAYGETRALIWHPVEAGGGARCNSSQTHPLPEETLEILKQEVVAIKGPLETPVGRGWRSLNVAIRQALDLYACVRPIRHFPGVVTPVRHPEDVDMVVFRENTEDIYTGIEWPMGSDETVRLLRFLTSDLGVAPLRFPLTTAIGIKPVSREGSQRLIAKAIQYAIDADRRSVTLVHKGNIMKYTEGGFCQWGYELAEASFGARKREGKRGLWFVNPVTGREIHIQDMIADNFLQQALLQPAQFDVIATLNLNGDYISDALAAQVGGIGIAPGANIGDGTAVFEATHGTAPDIAGQDSANPCSMLLSAEMLLRYIGFREAADFLVTGIRGALAHGFWTPDLIRAAQNAKGGDQGEQPVTLAETGFTLHPVGTRGMGEAVMLYMDVPGALG
ncbi:MAG: NADP-dependent isocitrate dehydrogenase [Gammaproteobacteria bacterium]